MYLPPLVVLLKFKFLPNVVCIHEAAQPTGTSALCTSRSSGRAEGTRCPEFCSTASPACEEQRSLTAPRSKPIRYVETSFNPKNTHVAQSGLWKKNKIKTKPNQKKVPHTQFVLFKFQETHTHSRRQSFCQLSLCFNLSSWASFAERGKKPNTLESWIYSVRFYPSSSVKLMKKDH